MGKPVDINKTKLDEVPSGGEHRASVPEGLSSEGRDHLHPGLQNNDSHATHGLNRQSGVNAQAPAHPPKGGKREHLKSERPEAKPVE